MKNYIEKKYLRWPDQTRTKKTAKKKEWNMETNIKWKRTAIGTRIRQSRHGQTNKN